MIEDVEGLHIESNFIPGDSEPTEPPKIEGRFRRIMMAIVLFIACPGDDLASLYSGRLAEHSNLNTDHLPKPEDILGLYWVDRRMNDQPSFKLVDENS